MVQAAKLYQHIYFKGILTTEFKSKNMFVSLEKKGSVFVSTEERKLWIIFYWLLWLD